MDNAVYQTYAVDENSGIEVLDLSVYRYKYLKRLDFQTISQVIEKDGWFFFNQPQHSFRTLVELVEKLDELGFRLTDCGRDRYPTIEPYLAIYHEAERKWWEQAIAEEMEKDRIEKREKTRQQAKERRCQAKAEKQLTRGKSSPAPSCRRKG